MFLRSLKHEDAKMSTVQIDMSISKQRKRFKRILQAAFGLTKKQIHVFNQIRDCANRETCVINLVQMMNSERSIIQKYLKVLMKKKLITRRSVTLSEFTERCQKNDREDIVPSTNKGYLYLYTPIPDDQLIQRIREITNGWIDEVETYCTLH